MTKGDIAKNNFQNGCNCAQAVLLAFCEDYGMDREIGLAKGKNKAEANNAFRRFAEEFKSKNGSLTCRELLGIRVKTRLTCADLCKDAGDILEKILL